MITPRTRFISRRTIAFKKLYAALPTEVRRLARENYRLWQENPTHSSLRFKELGSDIWSARVGLHWRTLARKIPNRNVFIWFWIGSHTEYDRLLKGFAQLKKGLLP